MAMETVGRALTLVLLLVKLSCCQNKVPDVTIQVLIPKGIRVSIPDVPKLGLFAFHGNINRAIRNSDVGTISGEVLQATNGLWVFEDPNVQLKVGDVINYYVFVSINQEGYVKDNLLFTVTDTSSPNQSTKPADCRPTLTSVRGGTACAGQVIFEDNFDTLDDRVWQIEQYIPIYHPEYPFVSYQRITGDSTVSTANGNLRVTPKLQQNMSGFTDESVYSGNLNLFSGCTAPAESCMVRATGPDILPPIVSGRVTTKGFAFTYGIVSVRAKLPQGDWLYPEILLEPFMKKYGSSNYASGVIKIAAARGNRELYIGATDYSNKLLYGGPIMDLECRDLLLTNKLRRDGNQWGDNFHVYSLRWEPDRIILMVDDEEWVRVEPPAQGLHNKFPAHCRQLPRDLLSMSTKMAPFDDHFYLTMGVAAGGITEFRDGLITAGGINKPWKNRERKAKLLFWQHMGDWIDTWANPELLVDYVKVVAL